MKVKRLIPALAMLLIAAMLMGTSTFAWFSMNRKVEATNMSVKAQAGPSLIITDDFVSGGTTTLQFAAGKMTETKQTEQPRVYPATAWANGMTDATEGHAAVTEPATKLVYVANGGDVDPTTGLAKTGKTLYYAPATTPYTPANGSDPEVVGYYYDFDFYLAAEGESAIEEGKLYVSVPAITDPTENALKAASVIVLVNGTAYGTPTLLTAGITDLVTITLSSSLSIPAVNASYQVATSSAVKVTFRVFVDGAALDTNTAETDTFVRNSAIVDLVNNSASFNATIEVKPN